MTADAAGDRPDLAGMTWVFARIGVLSFGGPAAQIALMHRELVERRPWLSESQFLNALSFCMLLPGPEAMQLATYAGWRVQGATGGLIAGALFVLPGAVVVLGLALLYAAFGQVPAVEALFLGIKATVIVIVIQALIRVAGKALKGPVAHALAAGAFVALYVFAVPFPAVIAVAAAVGALTTAPRDPAASGPPLPRTGGHLLRTCAIWLTVWLVPLAMLWMVAPGGLLAEVGLFFAKLAIVTFGGAYAVLAYMVQEVVADFGWLTTAEMMDALGLAETTPGPLILVTEFVGFLAGAREGGIGLGVAAALVTLWVTFAPCFLWIFAGAPYLEWVGQQPRLQGALTAITAAVVGVIANLSLWFALHVVFAEVGSVTRFGIAMPDWATLQPGALVLSAIAGALVLWRRLDLMVVLPIMAGLGLAWMHGLAPVFG